MQPSIIVHGGAWDIPAEQHDAHREAFFGINQRLFQKLEDFPRPVIAAIENAPPIAAWK